MKTIRALFLLCTTATLFHTRVAVAQAPTQPDAEKPHIDCEELPAVAAKLANAEKTLQDWPNLARYHDANLTVPPPAKNENRVVFMGDSITGQTTPQMLVRFGPDVIALQPKVVVILAGTNDLAGNTGPMTTAQIEDNLTSMDELAHANKIRVVLASVLPVSNYGHDRNGNRRGSRRRLSRLFHRHRRRSRPAQKRHQRRRTSSQRQRLRHHGPAGRASHPDGVEEAKINPVRLCYLSLDGERTSLPGHNEVHLCFIARSVNFPVEHKPVTLTSQTPVTP